MEGFSDEGGGDWPLALGELRGLRMFHFRGPQRPLMGTGWRGPGWQRGVNEAHCLASLPLMAHWNPPHRAPEPSCGCGFWAFWGLPFPGEEVRTAGGVAGVIRGWGRVLRGPRGFRSEKAEIAALAVVPSLALSRLGQAAVGLLKCEMDPAAVSAALSTYYRVPVFPTLEAMLAEYPVTGEPPARPVPA